MPKSKGVAVVAAGMCKWGARKATYRELIAEAGKACLDSNKNVNKDEIQGFILSSVYPARSAYITKVASLGSEVLGLHPSLYQAVENQCQSGTVGVRTGVTAIMAGMADIVMVMGAEKMLVPSPGDVFANAIAGFDREWEACLGITPPGGFALAAQAHMQKYGTTEEQLALVSVKNHNHSKNNPYAHFQKGATLEEVMNSRPVAYPFKLFDCSSNTDGAAAVILASADKARDLTDNPVWVLGVGQGFTGYTMANLPPDWTLWDGVRLAGERAYKDAGISPDEVDLAEVHDCFTISEIIEYEELGFCPKGEGGRFVQDGQADYGGKVVVNPRGGLIACGHPIGCTGVGQVCEVYWQLRGEAGPRQVAGAKIGLTQTMSNMGSESSVLILGNEEVL